MLKMAGSVGRILQRFALTHSLKTNFVKTTDKFIVPIVHKRTLYSKDALGITAYEQQREKIKVQLASLEDNFKSRMREYVQDDKNMIFTEDLKNMIHLSDSDDDIDLLIAMLKRFSKQNKQLRFGSFKFGPIVMRLFHTLNKPDLAMQCFKNEEFGSLFDQLISYQIYLDLLYVNGKYEDVLEGFRIIQDKQIEGAIFPKNSFILTLAACYKLNSKESLDYALGLWKKSENAGYAPLRRAVTFFAALALNQGKAEEALEILSNAKNTRYVTVRNLKALIFVELGRFEEAIHVLKSVIENDTNSTDVHTFNRDVIEKIKRKILESDNPEICAEFNRIEQLFQKQGNISEKTLDELLCSEITSPPIQKFSQQRPFDNRNYGERRQNNYQPRHTYRQRPGLQDLV